MHVIVIGAGLAGSEATYQLAKRNIDVTLYEMRPKKMTPAHKTDGFAELVCSNSLRSDQFTNAVGLLKEEMRRLDSLIIKIADETRIPAGSSLTVDRNLFSEKITNYIKSLSNVTIINEEITDIPNIPCIIATGPLTSDALSNAIKKLTGEDNFYFYDAASPIVTNESINLDKVYAKSRYDKGSDDFLNCPMTKEEFYTFYHELINGEVMPTHSFEKEIYFEGCLPIEVMAKRGDKALTFGPLKPVGLEMKDGKRPYAVVQLRKENKEGTLYNLVGFQTHLKWGEQKRIFNLIPGLEQAEFVRYGVMHRNSYINAPKILNNTYELKHHPGLFIAGQFAGVEGYIESAASGLVSGINMFRRLNNLELIDFKNNTMIGAMANYITNADPRYFQPMNANFGIFSGISNKKGNDKKLEDANYALDNLTKIINNLNNG